MGRGQTLNLPYSDELNIGYLGRLFDNTSECYKFFWFKAILGKVAAGERELSFEELIDEMIADAWYMVTEYHLNLGPKDNLEMTVNTIKEKNPSFASSMKKSDLLAYLKGTKDRDVLKKKRNLIQNVPYRLQAPFLQNIKGKEWDVPKKDLAEKINEVNMLLYYFVEINGFDSRIVINEKWAEYMVKNQEILKGWLEYNMIIYIQKRNPSVPGIAEKLYPPQERKLEDIKKYWKIILGLAPVREIYGDNQLSAKDISIDHFIPWSYVAHDEMWNLNPTTRSINSSKSNNLPSWEMYFEKLARLEYMSYQMIWKYEQVHKEFEKCAKKHINSDDVYYRIYSQGLKYDRFKGELEAVMLPVYQSARNCGFGMWEYR